MADSPARPRVGELRTPRTDVAGRLRCSAGFGLVLFVLHFPRLLHRVQSMNHSLENRYRLTHSRIPTSGRVRRTSTVSCHRFLLFVEDHPDDRLPFSAAPA